MARNNRNGVLALLGLGIFYAYRNRYKIQEWLGSQGINTPLDKSSVGSAISSGAAKVSGALQHGLKQDKDMMKGESPRKIG
jgi:hypothetical protein